MIRRYIVAGGVNFEDYETLKTTLDDLFKEIPKNEIEIISGHAKGAGISADDYMDMQGRTDEEAEKKKEEMDNMLSSKWDEILSRIIFCFTEQSEDKCSKQNEYEEAFRESRYQDEELKKKYHEKEKELEEYRNNMLEEGFELLCRCFHALWY